MIRTTPAPRSRANGKSLWQSQSYTLDFIDELNYYGDMSAPFYVTTPIYYVNGAPHLGHAYTTIAADAAARFHRMKGEQTYFLTGTDEHGQKIETAAQEAGKTPQAFADEIVETFRQAWSSLGISHDDFIRTTEERHAKVVSALWKKLEDAGDIYLGAYEGWYCVSCEAFYAEGDLVEDKKCPTHEKTVSWVSEPSYFFRMSKYQDALLKHFEDNPDFVQPANYRNEILSFIKSGLRDLSVSRTSFSWGIPVPDSGDEHKHVIYVWIDALTNYISALGGPESDKFKTFWPHAIHIIGKDILRFHAVYWPTMLLSAGLPLPKSIVTHGWWTIGGKKLAKSMPATRVDPLKLAKDLGNDPVRYYLLREVPFGPDGDFAYESLLQRYHSDLANDLGNLLNRALSMSKKYFNGLPDVIVHNADDELSKLAVEIAVEASGHFEAFAFSKALESIWRLIRETNRFIDTQKPWQLAKAGEDEKLRQVMAVALEAITWASRLAAPVLPESAEAIFKQLGQDANDTLMSWPTAKQWGKQLTKTAATLAPTPIFPRFDDKQSAELIGRWLGDAIGDAKISKSEDSGDASDRDTVSFEDFSKLELRIGQVTSAEPIPKTKKLLKLLVDIGEEMPRQVVAGLAEAFSAEELTGQKVIVVANLKPAKIRGVKSNGMILAAGDKQILGLATVSADAPVGTRVR